MVFRTVGNFGGYHQWGGLLHIPPNDADLHLLDIVLKEVSESIVPASCDVPELKASPAERQKQSRVLRDYEPVSISLFADPELWIQPLKMSPRGGGGMGDPKDRVLLRLPGSNKQFIEALDLAYSRCGVVYGL